MRERRFPSSLIFFIRFGLFELVFLTPLVFYGWATTFSSVKQTFAQVGCLVLLCGLSFELPYRKPGLSFPDITTFFIIFFGIFLMVSSLWSASFYASFLGLGIWGTFFAVYFLTAAIVEDEKWMRLLLIAAVASGALAALYSIFQFYEVELPIWRKVTGRMRLFSTFGNPNYLAGYLAASLHLAFFFFFTQRRWKYLWLVVVGILYTSLLITCTRGAWIALFFSSIFVLVLLFFYRREFFKANRSSMALLLLVILTITLVFSTPNPLNLRKISIVERGASAMELKSSSIQQRLLIWHAAAELIKQRPILGWGVGTFGVHYPLAQGKFLSRPENKGFLPQTNRSINTHNDYLHVLSEVGVVGFFLFAMILGTFYFRFFSFLRKNSREDFVLPHLYLIFFAGSLSSFLIHALVSFPFHITQNGMLFWMIFALSGRIISGRIKWEKSPGEGEVRGRDDLKKSSSACPKTFIRWLILLVVVAGSLYLSFWRIKIFISDLHVKQAELFMEAGLYSAARKELEEAIKIDPFNAQAFADLTEIYTYAGLYQKVIQAAEKAELNWNTPNIHNRASFAYLKLGDIDRAKQALLRCIFLYPNFAAGYINWGYLSLLEAEKNLKGGELDLAEKKLDEAFLSYIQGNIWQEKFPLPAKLSLAYNKYYQLGGKMENDWEIKKIQPPFFFYSPKEWIVRVLPPFIKSGEHFNLCIFIYGEKDLSFFGKGESLSLRVGIRSGEGWVWRKDFPNLALTVGAPFILKSRMERKVSPGEYTAVALLGVGKKVLSVEKVKFAVLPG